MTAEEFKALGHPLRLRILRLCLHEALTNQQLAAMLNADPATVLHHVRTLVAAGLIEAEASRPGPRGPHVKPYRATGSSWNLDADQVGDDDVLHNQLAMIDAVRDEVASAGAPADHLLRLGLKTNERTAAELHERMWAIINEFAEREDDPDGDHIGLLAVLHRQNVPAQRSPDEDTTA